MRGPLSERRGPFRAPDLLWAMNILALLAMITALKAFSPSESKETSYQFQHFPYLFMVAQRVNLLSLKSLAQSGWCQGLLGAELRNLKEGWRPQRAQARKGSLILSTQCTQLVQCTEAPWSFVPWGYEEPLSCQMGVAEGSGSEEQNSWYNPRTEGAQTPEDREPCWTLALPAGYSGDQEHCGFGES